MAEQISLYPVSDFMSRLPFVDRKLMLLVGLCGVLLLVHVMAHRPPPQVLLLNPAKTWVFVVGILEWQDQKSFPSFPKDERRDADLVDFFSHQGVPSDHIVYLQDQVATTEVIETEFEQFLTRPAPGDFVFVYYCGHGRRDGQDVRLISYDTTQSNKGWSVHGLIEAVGKHATEWQALVTADCCDSGSIVKEIEKLNSKIAIAGLTSTTETGNSTENWTFSEALLDALCGECWADVDGNKVVSLPELVQTVQKVMVLAEGQEALFAATAKFSMGINLATAFPKSTSRIGDFVSVKQKKILPLARITASSGSFLRLHFLGKARKLDVWLDPAEIDPAPEQPYRVGQNVLVEWQGSWYAASVLKVAGNGFFIHYTGYSVEWDEWIPPRRIRPIGEPLNIR
ncbi:MAG: caspase family protein [Blastocatellia bacterium]|nr:caspase family protein [Blastocatellia bacterium]